MTHSDTLGELYAALAQAQGEIENAVKDKTGHAGKDTKTRYADLAGVWDVIRAPFAKAKISVLQPATVEIGDRGVLVTVRTRFGHASGQYVEESLTVLAASAFPQQIGSAITYARRYQLSAMAGVAAEDDDGAAAQPTHHANGRQFATPPPKPAKPLAESVRDYEAELVAKRLVKTGELIAHLEEKLGAKLDAVKDGAKARSLTVAFVDAKRDAAKHLLSGDQFDHIDELMGNHPPGSWPSVVERLGLPAGTMADRLNPTDADLVISFLQSLPAPEVKEEEWQ